MMRFEILSAPEGEKRYLDFYPVAKETFESFPGFDHWNKRLFRGDFRLLAERQSRQILSLRTENGTRALATFYRTFGTDPSPERTCSLGCFLIAPQITPEETRAFWRGVRDFLSAVDQPVVGPFNGHMNLGCGVLEEHSQALPAFLTGPVAPRLARFLSDGDFPLHRRLHAYTLQKSAAVMDLLKRGQAERPKGVTTRPLSRRHFRRDMGIYNALVNECMKDHPGFVPLSTGEDWELMKNLFPLLEPAFFRFLLIDGEEVGLCFGVPDYIPLLTGTSDLGNFSRALLGRKRVRRGRIVYSCVSSRARGRRLFRFVRHEVLAAMFESGIETVESSLIDEGNAASLANTKSTGGRHSHDFLLYRFKTPG